MTKASTYTVLEKLNRLSRLLAADAYADGLNPAQWDALRFLDHANRFSRTPSGMTAYLNATKGTVSQTIAALEMKGFVYKRPGSIDKRQVFLEITDAGRELLSQDPHASMKAIISTLPEAELEQLNASLGTLMVSRLKKTGGAAFGICKTCIHFKKAHPEGSPHYCTLLQEPLGSVDANSICAEQVSRPAA